MRSYLLLLAIVMVLPLTAQNSLLQSGPMLGYSEMREVVLWVQTTEAAEVQFAYWPENEKAALSLTDKTTTTKDDAFTAKLIADIVEPGTSYTY